MSLSKFRLSFVAALVFTGLGLSACGFTPLYGRTGSSAQVVGQLATIDVRPIPDRVGQMMRTELKRRLSINRPQGPAQYKLTVTLSEGIAQLAVEQSAFATRANLHLSSSFNLVRTSDGLEVTKGSPSTVASYNILSSDFATQTARADARERAVIGLAQIINQRLSVYFLAGDRSTGTPEQ